MVQYVPFWHRENTDFFLRSENKLSHVLTDIIVENKTLAKRKKHNSDQLFIGELEKINQTLALEL